MRSAFRCRGLGLIVDLGSVRPSGMLAGTLVFYFCLLERSRPEAAENREFELSKSAKFNRRTGTSNPRVLLLLDVYGPPTASPRWQYTLRTRRYPLTWSVKQPVIVVGPPRRKR